MCAVQRSIVNQLHLQQPLLSGKGFHKETLLLTACLSFHTTRGVFVWLVFFNFSEKTRGPGQRGWCTVFVQNRAPRPLSRDGQDRGRGL